MNLLVRNRNLAIMPNSLFLLFFGFFSPDGLMHDIDHVGCLDVREAFEDLILAEISNEA